MLDDDDKVRRNIVVASAAVLLVTWLKLPLTELGERFLSVKTVGEAVRVSELRVWIAVLAALGYLGLRYFWSKEVVEARESIDETYHKYYKRSVKRIYLRQVELWAKRRKFPADSHPDLPLVLRNVVLAPSAESDATVVLEKIEFKIIEALPAQEAFTARVRAFNVLNGGSHIASEDLKFPIDDRRRAKLKFRSFVYAHIWSKGSMSILWPIALWCIAVGICIVKLAIIALERFHVGG